MPSYSFFNDCVIQMCEISTFWLVTWRVSCKRQEMLTLRDVFWWVHVAHLFSFFMLSYYVSLRSQFRVVMSVTIPAYKRCSVRLYLQLFVARIMSYCVFVYRIEMTRILLLPSFQFSVLCLLLLFCLSSSCVLCVFVVCLVCLRHVFCLSSSCVLFVFVMCLVCLRHVFCLSSSCVLFVFVMCLVCLRHVFCLSSSCVLCTNVASFSVLSFLITLSVFFK